ncbi:MAG: DUF2141 domain-containing protein [Bacteroidota bacterium]|nr:DUF2141 domain-containing protein [Bacteroidota bacterium]
MRRTILSIFLLLFVACLGAQTVKLDIHNIKTTRGSIQLMFYKNAESYKNDCPYMIKRFAKDSVHEGCMTLSIHLPKGEYGIILLDDENDSEEMENSILGLPKEGFGFAGYHHRGIRRPSYDDFKFELEEGIKKIGLRVRYM